MNEQERAAGDEAMKRQEQRSAVQTSVAVTNAAWGAGMLILLGLALQWVEILVARFASDNSWFLTTLFGEAWNMITLWFSTTPWRDDLRYWPLLLVVVGGAILFSRGGSRRESPEAAREMRVRNDV